MDGVGGTVKRAVWRRTLQGQSIVNNAAEFAEVAMTACPNVTVLYVPASEVAEVKLQLDVLWDNHVPTAIPQLRAHHYISILMQTLQAHCMSRLLVPLPQYQSVQNQ